MPLGAFWFAERSLIWLLRAWQVLCRFCHIPGTISRVFNSPPNIFGAGGSTTSSICGLTTSTTFDSAVPYFLSVSQQYRGASPDPGCVKSSRFMGICWKLSMRCSTVLEIVPITQPSSSSSLRMPSSICSSSSFSSSPSCSSSDLARSLRLSLTALNISSNVFTTFLVVNSVSSPFPISSYPCSIAVSASWTGFLVTAFTLSTKSSMHFTVTSLIENCISRHLSATNIFSQGKLQNGWCEQQFWIARPRSGLEPEPWARFDSGHTKEQHYLMTIGSTPKPQLKPPFVGSV